MYKVVCIGNIHKKGINLLDSRKDLITYEIIKDSGDIENKIKDADAIIVRTTPLSKKLLNSAKNLKIVSRHGVGVDNIDVAYLSERKIPVTIALGANVASVAEHTVMLMLVLAKNLIGGDLAVRNDNFTWRDELIPVDVAGKIVMLVGFGRIGKRVAEICNVLDMKVMAYDPYCLDKSQHGVEFVADFLPHLSQIDFLSLHLPANSETRDMINDSVFHAMKEGSFLINCARGGILDEDALCDAIENGKLKGAALDVFASEPPKPGSRILRQAGIIFSPHNAALTEECAIRMAEKSAQNVIDFFENNLISQTIVNIEEL